MITGFFAKTFKGIPLKTFKGTFKGHFTKMPLITGFFAKTFKGHSFKQQTFKGHFTKIPMITGFLQKPLKDNPLNNL